MNDIPDSHIEFARELVVLARKHSMNNLNVDFDHNGSKNWEAKLPWDVRNTKTFFSWSEGRHGAKTEISMVREERINFKETEPYYKETT